MEGDTYMLILRLNHSNGAVAPLVLYQALLVILSNL